MPLQSALPGTWQVPASIRSRIGDSAGRQRVIFEESHLVLVLHHPPKPGDLQRIGRFL